MGTPELMAMGARESTQQHYFSSNWALRPIRR